MNPTLPQNAPSPESRASQLNQSRDTYKFDHSFFNYALVASVPKSDQFNVGYLADGAEHALRLATNRGASRLGNWTETEVESASTFIKDLFAGTDATTAYAEAQAIHQKGLSDAYPLSIDDYEDMYPLLPKPRSLQHWREDWYFAWQRIAGCNPILMQQVRRIPDHFKVSAARFGETFPYDTLEKALAEGRIYLVDYPMMANVPLGQTDGRQKYLDAPMALFVRTIKGPLMPAAIQCTQTPDPKRPVYTPKDGAAWEMAKAMVQVADANHQGIIAHLGYCHLVLESAIIAAKRQLAQEHPLMVLLEPHFEFTLATNDVAKRQLIGPGGNTDILQSGTNAGSTALVLDALATYRFDRTDAPTFFSERGLDDTEALPSYPFRDDVLLSYGPIRDFVAGYIALYYQSDAEVSNDSELQAWVAEWGDPKGGNILGITESGKVKSIAEVSMLITRLIYKCTSFHSAINYSSFDFLGYPPNMPPAAWAPGPAGTGKASEADLLALMPPADLSFRQIHLMYTIMMQRNRLGEYPRRHFHDRRVEPLLALFQKELKEADASIVERNQDRPAVYDYVRPSLVPASIHV